LLCDAAHAFFTERSAALMMLSVAVRPVLCCRETILLLACEKFGLKNKPRAKEREMGEPFMTAAYLTSDQVFWRLVIILVVQQVIVVPTIL
jgi:hypothetical protein